MKFIVLQSHIYITHIGPTALFIPTAIASVLITCTASDWSVRYLVNLCIWQLIPTITCATHHCLISNVVLFFYLLSSSPKRNTTVKNIDGHAVEISKVPPYQHSFEQLQNLVNAISVIRSSVFIVG